ncbi:MAG: TetR/AcrR family transcriptional regulator [Arcicella sp.]|nr:TetR/AcrR family transcriptional regulator [Arcicella sp.]
MEIKDRIIAKAREQFFRYGVKSVTMDDIANELGISKKTIYQHFEDKDALVYQLMKAEMEQDKCEWEKLEKTSKNVIEKTVKSMDLFKQAFTEINPSTLFDIKKYHPNTWQLFQDHKQNFILTTIIKDLREGIEQGLFRDNIKVEILAKLRLEQVEFAFDPQIFPPNKFNIVDVEITLLDHFFRGIMTQKGLQVYEECL